MNIWDNKISELVMVPVQVQRQFLNQEQDNIILGVYVDLNKKKVNVDNLIAEPELERKKTNILVQQGK